MENTKHLFSADRPITSCVEDQGMEQGTTAVLLPYTAFGAVERHRLRIWPSKPFLVQKEFAL